MRILGSVTLRMQHRVRSNTAALFLGGVCLVSPLGAALADDTAEDLKQLRAAIQKGLADLKKREQKLHQEFLRLDQKSQLLDDQLRQMRAAGAARDCHPNGARRRRCFASCNRKSVKAGSGGSGPDLCSVPVRSPRRKAVPQPHPRHPRGAETGPHLGAVGRGAASKTGRRNRSDAVDRRRCPDAEGPDRDRPINRV